MTNVIPPNNEVLQKGGSRASAIEWSDSGKHDMKPAELPVIDLNRIIESSSRMLWARERMSVQSRR